ncbi:MAG: FliH/SctL family protein [Syntrophales bacterium]
MSSSKSKILRPSDIRMVEKPAGLSPIGGPPEGGCEPGATDGERLRLEFEEKLRRSAAESYEKGLREGVKRGREAQQAEARRQLDTLAGLLAEVASLKRKILEESEPDILELVFAVAEKVLNREVAQQPDSVVPVLKAAMKNVMDRDGVKIRLHPLDYQHLLEIREDFLRQTDGLRNVVFEQDESLRRGGVFIETRFGDVDARLDRQLGELKAQMKRGKTAGAAEHPPQESGEGDGIRAT